MKFYRLLPVSLITLALAASGCGGAPSAAQSALKKKTSTSAGTDDSADDEPTDGSANSAATAGTSPLIVKRVGTVGYNSATIEVSTHHTLKVMFTPGKQDENVSGTGFQPSYSMLGVYVQVGDDQRATALLSNGLLAAKENSEIFDFSGAIANPCSSDNPSCRVKVKITVLNPNYDYWCLSSNSFCPYTHVYETHPWHGSLTVQTDDTTKLQ